MALKITFEPIVKNIELITSLQFIRTIFPSYKHSFLQFFSGLIKYKNVGLDIVNPQALKRFSKEKADILEVSKLSVQKCSFFSKKRVFRSEKYCKNPIWNPIIPPSFPIFKGFQALWNIL